MTKEEAINEIERHKKIICSNCMMPQEVGWCKGCEVIKALDEAIDALKAQQWIPCSERLPEEHKFTYPTVIVCDAYGGIGLGYYAIKLEIWCVIYGSCREAIIAWMPFPEPMKGEQDDN